MIRVACTALLKRIVAGRSNKDGTALVGGGDDVTGDCLKATAELIGAGNSLTLKVNDADAYVIAVKAVDGANVAAQSAQTEMALSDDARDAARYRWLREQHWNEADMAVVCHPKKSVKLGFDCPSGQRLDEAIDVGMTTAQPASSPKRGRMSRQEKINESREIVAARLQHLERPLNGRCAAGNDGECSHSQCPQLRDGEPMKSGRHCPLDVQEEDL
ncbi:DUF7446 family protein [Paraburkholderia sp.]|uniref:DUF7446 family protein n=1 Tax=Paraburkholderia sp. TaxID=1926495 RepID=UPI003C7B2367